MIIPCLIRDRLSENADQLGEDTELKIQSFCLGI